MAPPPGIASTILMMNNPVIILVRPQLGENIGAAARAMLNFGLNNLRLVSPRDGWPNPKANDTAVGAEKVVLSAEVFADLSTALHDIHVSYATSARTRYMNKAATTSDQIGDIISQELSQGCKVAIIFGPERTGLTNEEIVLANKTVSIPTLAEFSSINLAQSVAIICYELFYRNVSSNTNQGPDTSEYATEEDITGLFNHLEATLDNKDFFKVPAKRAGMIRNIRNIFKRINQFTKQDIRTLRGIIRTLSE